MVKVVVVDPFATAILVSDLPLVRFEACVPQVPEVWFSGRPYQLIVKLPGSTRSSERMAPW